MVQQEMRDGAEVTRRQVRGLGHESLTQRHHSVRPTLGVWELGDCGGPKIRGGEREEECRCVLAPGLDRSGGS